MKNTSDETRPPSFDEYFNSTVIEASLSRFSEVVPKINKLLKNAQLYSFGKTASMLTLIVTLSLTGIKFMDDEVFKIKDILETLASLVLAGGSIYVNKLCKKNLTKTKEIIQGMYCSFQKDTFIVLLPKIMEYYKNSRQYDNGHRGFN